MPQEKDKERNLESIALTVLIGGMVAIPPFFQGSVSPRFYLLINLLGSVTLGTWAALIFYKRTSVAFYKTPLYTIIGLFAYLMVVTVSTSIYSEASLHYFFKVANCMILLIVVTNAVANGLLQKSDLDILQFIILFTGFALAVFSILAPITFLENDPLRTYPFINKNHLAGYLELAMPMAFAYYFTSRKIEMRLTAIGMFLGMLGAMLMSLSRGGIVSFSIALVIFMYVYFFHIRPSAFKFITYLTLPVLATILILMVDTRPLIEKFKIQRIFSDNLSPSASERMEIYSGTLKLIAQKPILGHGPGTFAYVFPQFRTPKIYGQPYYAHNDYLELLSDNGLIGFGLVMAGLAIGFVFFFRTMSVRRDSNKKAQSWFCLIGVMSLLIHSLVDFNLHIPSNMLAFTLMAALALSYIGLPSGGGVASPYPEMRFLYLNRFRKVLILGATGAFIVFTFYFSVTRLLADMNYRKGEENLQNGLLDKAYYNFSRASELVPGNAEYHYQKGVAYFLSAINNQQSYNIAVQEISQAALLNPNESRYLLDLAGVLQVKRAENLFEPLADKALTVEPNNPYTHKILATHYLENEQVEKGLWHLRKAGWLNPDVIDNQVLQIAWGLVAKPEELKEVFNTSATVLGKFAHYAQNVGEEGIAADAYRDALKLDPTSNQYYFSLVKLYLANKHYKDAEKVCKLLVGRWPRDAAGYRLLANVYLSAGDNQKADKYLRRAIEIDPKVTDVYPKLVNLYLKDGRDDDLIIFFKKIIENEDQCLAELNHYLSRIYNNKKEWLLAINFSKKAKQCDGQNTKYAMYLVDLYMKRQLYFEASMQIEQLHRLKGNDSTVLWKMAEVYEAYNKPKKALKVYINLHYLEPNNDKIRAKIDQLSH